MSSFEKQKSTTSTNDAKNIELRNINASHLPALKELFSKNQDFFGKGGIIADDLYDRIEDEISSNQPDGIRRMGIWLADRMIGYVGLIQEDMNANEIEVSYALDKEFTKRGIARAAIQTVTDHETDDGNQVIAEVEARNHKSMQLLEDLGYKRQQRMRDGRFVFKKDATDVESLMHRLEF